MMLPKTQTELEIDECCVCGGWHALPKRIRDHCYQNGGTWYCPNGHKIGWPKGTLKKKLEQEQRRREMAEHRAKAEAENAEHERRRASSYKGKLTSMKKRAAAGVCPCCKRTFKQLSRHMKCKHPEYEADK